MRTEKNKIEARRWLHTADDDIDTAIILKENGKFAHSCFHAQQAAKKAESYMSREKEMFCLPLR